MFEMEKIIELIKERDLFLNKIIKVASTREGQHILEIVNNIRELCDKLEDTIKMKEE